MTQQVMPPLSPNEYEALKADIDKRGVLIPIVVDADTGDVIDGHHRLRACQELGKEAPRVEWRFANDEERKEYALILNLLRRHLGPITWAWAFEQLAKVRGVAIGTDGGRPSTLDIIENNSPTVGELSNEIGVPYTTAKRRLQLAADLSNYPDLADKVDKGEMAAKRARRVVREREAEKRNQELPPIPELLPTIEIHHCDFRNLVIADNSVDLIFTDPPYAKKYLPLWSDLGIFAVKVLKAGSLLISYSGQFWLPEVLERLGQHLIYAWTGSLVLNGAHNNVQQRHIRNRSKPLLFFVKDKYQTGPWFDDTFFSEERVKDDHEWQQSIGAAKYYIEKLTNPGDLVVDPYLGSGTTAKAAKELNRRFIGCDIDVKAVKTTRKKLA